VGVLMLFSKIYALDGMAQGFRYITLVRKGGAIKILFSGIVSFSRV